MGEVYKVVVLVPVLLLLVSEVGSDSSTKIIKTLEDTYPKLNKNRHPPQDRGRSKNISESDRKLILHNPAGKVAHDIVPDFEQPASGNTEGAKIKNLPPSSSSSSSESGTSSWVFIMVGVAVAVAFGVTMGLTFLHRRRQAAQRLLDTTDKKEGRAGAAMPGTVHSVSTDRSSHKSKATVSTYLSAMEGGEEVELLDLSHADRQRASVQDLFEAQGPRDYPAPFTSPSATSSLPRVKVVNQSRAALQDSRGGSVPLLKACIGSIEAEDSLRGFSNLFRPDDGNKLRGGNGDFARRYVDVDYMNTDIPQRRKPTPSNSSDRYQRHKANTRNRNESNASSSTISHHSARSFISIPPTSPTENYVEAGSDDWSLRSQRSTPPTFEMEWLTKDTRADPKNELSTYQSTAHTQTEGTPEVTTTSKTVFGTQWQFGGTFTSRGGVMQAKDSEVSLTVVANAITKGDYVDLYGAIFTDTVEIRKKFSVSMEESLISPVVEYHAVNKPNFNRHVCVQLPHSLADDFDSSSVKVYTFNVSERGQVRVQSVPQAARSNTDREETIWERGQDGTILISTLHFSGYFCTVCEAKSLPSICTMVFGSHVQITGSRREVRVILYVWDRRLIIKDYLERFRKQESDVDRQLLTDMQIPLLEEANSNSRLLMRMEPLGESIDHNCWRHISRANGSRPLFKPLQVRKLSEIVHCCRQTDPLRVEWALENVPQQVPSSVFQCCIDIMHVSESTIDYETALREDNDDLMRTFYVRDLKVTSTSRPKTSGPEEPQEFVRVDLKRTLSELMNVQQTENLCKEYGLASKDIGNFRKKYTTDGDIQAGLVEECLRRYGSERFLKQLPEVLHRLSLTSVLQQLEGQNIVVDDLTDFRGYSNTSMAPGSAQPEENCAGRNLETTRYKTPHRDLSVLNRSYTDRRQQSQSPPLRGQPSLCDSSTSPTGLGYQREQRSPERYHCYREGRSNISPTPQPNRISDDVFYPVHSGHHASLGPSPGPPGISPPSDFYKQHSLEEDEGRLPPRASRRMYPGLPEECQPLNPYKSSSSGSDSVLRSSSLHSPEGAQARSDLPFPEGYSLLAAVDSSDFLEREMFDSHLQESGTSMATGDPAAYPEIAEEQCFSNCGPQALYPNVSNNTQDGPSVNSNTHAGPSVSNKHLENSHSTEETSKKELYGVQTIV